MNDGTNDWDCKRVTWKRERLDLDKLYGPPEAGSARMLPPEQPGEQSPCIGCCGNVCLEGHAEGVCGKCAYAGVEGGIFPGNFLRLPVKPVESLYDLVVGSAMREVADKDLLELLNAEVNRGKADEAVDSVPGVVSVPNSVEGSPDGLANEVSASEVGAVDSEET